MLAPPKLRQEVLNRSPHLGKPLVGALAADSRVKPSNDDNDRPSAANTRTAPRSMTVIRGRALTRTYKRGHHTAVVLEVHGDGKFVVAEQHIIDPATEKDHDRREKKRSPHDFPDTHQGEGRAKESSQARLRHADYHHEDDYHRQREDLSIPAGEECPQEELVAHLQAPTVGATPRVTRLHAVVLLLKSLCGWFDFFDVVVGLEIPRRRPGKLSSGLCVDRQRMTRIWSVLRSAAGAALVPKNVHPKQIGRSCEDLPYIAETCFMAELVPSRSCFRDVRRVDMCCDCVPLFQRVGGPMRLLQIPPAVPMLSILPVRTRVLIDGEYSLSAADPSDLAHYVQLFRCVQVVQRKTDPYDADRIRANPSAPARNRSRREPPDSSARAASVQRYLVQNAKHQCRNNAQLAFPQERRPSHSRRHRRYRESGMDRRPQHSGDCAVAHTPRGGRDSCCPPPCGRYAIAIEKERRQNFLLRRAVAHLVRCPYRSSDHSQEIAFQFQRCSFTR